MGFWDMKIFNLKESVNPLTWFEQQEGDEKSNIEGWIPPEYYEDPIYKESQEVLKNLGFDILKGDIPEYYAPIGEIGGKEFENYLSLMKGDIEASVEAGAAKLGRRGGVVSSQIAEQVGEFSTKTRYADFLRAMEGRKGLLNTGRGVTEGVRGSAQQEQVNRSSFNLNKSGQMFNYLSALDKQEAAAGDSMGEMLSMALNAGVGFATGGPVGAVAGAMGGIDWVNLLESSQKSKLGKTTVGTSKDKKIGLGGIKPYKQMG